MTARTAQQIEADGARPEAAVQQAQLEAWGARHGMDDYDWNGGMVAAAIAADEVDAYAADGFMSANREDLAKVTEERFGALPRRKAHHEGQRMRFIATMHALIAFVVDNPDLPAPWSAGLNINVKESADVQAFLDKYEEATGSDTDSAGRPRHATLFRPLDDDEFYTPISVSVRQNPES